jgi:hypothetical protein
MANKTVNHNIAFTLKVLTLVLFLVLAFFVKTKQLSLTADETKNNQVNASIKIAVIE